MCTTGFPYITSVSHSPWSGFSSSVMAVYSIDILYIFMGWPLTSGHLLLALLLAFLSPFWMTRWSDDWMTGHVTSFFGIQFDAQSIGMLTDVYMSSYMIQCSYSHFFISAFSLSLIGYQFISHSGSLYATGVGLTWRKDRDKTHKVLVLTFLYLL